VFRLINIAGRAAIELGGNYYDLGRLTGDDAMADPMAWMSRSDELHGLAERCVNQEADGEIGSVRLGPPVPSPRQVFAIGLNYQDHAAESGMELPPAPLTFTKFPSCIAGPTDDIALTSALVDWEVELVAVIGRRCKNVAAEQAWDVLAGITLGQDVSGRGVQFTGSPPQFCLGKSFTSFGPIGPALVSVDSFADRHDIAITCAVNGEQMQASSTAHLIFDLPTLVAYLSSICELWPGDLIFTGTPDGIGASRGKFLAEGDVLTSEAPVIGSMINRCVAGTGVLPL
jgi:2-keto-4-pentenoate hydratase/2-oxohepta-3-ene-1,7-dioic acid hydratase in catechol pathway